MPHLRTSCDALGGLRTKADSEMDLAIDSLQRAARELIGYAYELHRKGVFDFGTFLQI